MDSNKELTKYFMDFANKFWDQLDLRAQMDEAFIRLPKITESKEGSSIRFDIHHRDKNIGYLIYEPLAAVWLDGIYVDPAYRRRNYGRYLMRHFINREGHREIRLHVSPFEKDKTRRPLKTEILVNFYKKFGFVIEPGRDNCMIRRP